MKKIVMFVEGEGEANAAPLLVKKLLNENPEVWKSLTVDPHPFRVGEVNKLVKGNNWPRKLQAALKRKNVGGVLVLLDGDIKQVGGEQFCAASIARRLASESRAVGGGTTFSVAITFAKQEFESWLIAGYDSLAGKVFPDGRRIPAQATVPGELEQSPRDAKGWLKKLIVGGYKASRDQEVITKWLDVRAVRKTGLRSFQRLESAVSELVSAIQSGSHVTTPSHPSSL